MGAKCLDDEEHKPYRSCKCPEKFTVSLEKLECQPILYKLNETCNESSQCQAGLGQAECILVNKTILGMTTGSRKKCLCKPNSHFSKDFQKCVITRSKYFFFFLIKSSVWLRSMSFYLKITIVSKFPNVDYFSMWTLRVFKMAIYFDLLTL